MKERVLIVLKDRELLEESASILYDHDYLVTKASNLSDMESQMNATPHDLILIESSLWLRERPDLVLDLEQKYSGVSIVHLILNGDQETLDRLYKNGSGIYLFQPVTAKEILVTVDQTIRYRELSLKYKQMLNEFRDVNKNLSNKTKELQELVAFNNNIIESVDAGIMSIDTQFIIKSWNLRMSEICGIFKSEAIGSNMFECLPWLNIENVPEKIALVLTEGNVDELNRKKGKGQNGVEIYADYRISPIKKGDVISGAVITVYDIRQKTPIEDELESPLRYTDNLVEHSADAIISLDPDGIIVTWNKGAETMFGYGAQEAIGRSWDFMVPAQDRKKMHNLFQWVNKGIPVSNFDTQVINNSGMPVPVSLTVSLIKDDEGKVLGLSGICKCLSATGKQRRQTIQSQKMVSIGIMAAGLAENITNPLASLSINAGLLSAKTDINGLLELTECLGKMEADADQISQLAKDLLWYSKAPKDESDAVDMHDALEKSIKFTRLQTDMHNIEIRRAYLAKQSRIIGNNRELIQAFINIFTNAQAAMPDGGVITVQTESIIAEEDSMEGKACISIKIEDTGMGIPEENMHRIFEQFFTTNPNSRSNGLGLYVVNAIIENHSGNIEVESRVNKGTCITIRLPVHMEERGIRDNQNE
ncbi:PAS domain S-box protein [bacterium]|nr:PAS domain S-box protein [bacterium]